MIKTFNIPSPETKSTDFDIKIGGKSVDAYKARVSKIPFNQVWPGHQRPLSHTTLSSFVSFDTDERVKIEVTPKKAFNEVVIRPKSDKYELEVKDGIISFYLSPLDTVSLELDGHDYNLHIFANETKALPEVDENTLYFGAGSHEIGQIFLKDNQTVIIDSGAIVYGSIIIKDAKNVRVCGNGVLCNSNITRMGLCFPVSFLDNENCTLPDEYQALESHTGATKIEYTGCMKIINSENVKIEGITYRDSSEWTCIVANCKEVHFDNVKLIGMWRYNADGIDYCNSTDGSIKNTFFRNFDDCIVVKGLKPYDNGMICDNLYFENNVIWCDWGRCLEIGAETCADEMKNLTFKNNKIIHATYGCMDVQNGDRGYVHDVLFEGNIIEYSKYQTEPIYQVNDEMEYCPQNPPYMPEMFTSICMHCYWSQDDTRGTISDIYIKDTKIYTDEPDMPYPKVVLTGLDEEHTTDNLVITGTTFNGKKIAEEIELIKNEFIGKVTIE